MGDSFPCFQGIRPGSAWPRKAQPGPSRWACSGIVTRSGAPCGATRTSDPRAGQPAGRKSRIAVAGLSRRALLRRRRNFSALSGKIA